jgi:hypothetical protein
MGWTGCPGHHQSRHSPVASHFLCPYTNYRRASGCLMVRKAGMRKIANSYGLTTEPSLDSLVCFRLEQ